MKSNLLHHLQERDHFISDAMHAYYKLEEERMRGYRKIVVEGVGVVEKEYLEGRRGELERYCRSVGGGGGGKREEKEEEEEEEEEDLIMKSFITRHRDPDGTRMYFKAMFLLDWDWNRQQRKKRKAEKRGSGGGGSSSSSNGVIKERSGIDAILGPLLRETSLGEEGGGGSGGTNEEVVEEEDLAEVPFGELIEKERGRAYFLQVKWWWW